MNYLVQIDDGCLTFVNQRVYRERSLGEVIANIQRQRKDNGESYWRLQSPVDVYGGAGRLYRTTGRNHLAGNEFVMIFPLAGLENY